MCDIKVISICSYSYLLSTQLSIMQDARDIAIFIFILGTHRKWQFSVPLHLSETIRLVLAKGIGAEGGSDFEAWVIKRLV